MRFEETTVTRDEIQNVILTEIDVIAPGSVPDGLDADADMREEMDLDSMDILNLVEALHDKLGVEIPEADLGEIMTLNSAIQYIERALGA